MNHIYKVIWNKAKHCYTVVSEIAKSHSQSNKRVRSMTAVVAAAMMLTGFGGMAIEAANPASGDTNITIGKGASVSIWNGVPGHDGFTSGYISIGENAFAWDGEHTYKEKYARIGTKEYLLDFNQGAVGVAESFWGIPLKFRVTDGTKLAGAIAIGKNTMARTGSVMIGDHTYKGQLGDIEVDPSNKSLLNNGVYSTTLGTSSYNSGSMATVTGALSIASGSKDTNDTQNFGATIYGSLNSIESSTARDSETGMANDSAGTANSVLGFGNRTQNANASLVWGTGNEVTNSIEDVTFSTNWNKTSASDAQKEIIKAMQSDQFAGGSVMAIGGGNKADWATYSQLLGVKNTLIGENGAVSKYDMINGYKNKVTNATNTSIIGSNNTATNIQSTIVMGDHNTATNIQSTIVMGDHNTLEGRKNVISLGNKNTVVVDDAVAIGNGTTVSAKSGVAIGVGSVADRVADSEKGKRGEFAPDTIPTGQESTWTSTRGAVSVGDTANNITRQITNVAAGNEDTDAVNVAQLKQVASQAEKANQGWNLSTNGAAATNVAPGDSVDFSGDDNVSVSNKETRVTVALNKDVKLNSATFEDTVINANGLTIGGGTSGLEFSKTRVSVGGQQIHDVADGEADMDAVNMSQLNKQAAASKTTVSDGTNTNVTSTVAGDGHTDYQVNLNKDLTGIESISNGTKGKSKIVLNEGYAGMAYGDTNVVLMNNGVYLNGKVNVDKAGQIHNVTAGTADEDAVNVSQLNKQAAASKTTVSDGTNTNVTSTVAGDGHTDYQVNLNKDLTGIESISNGTKGKSKIVLNEGYAGMAYGDTNVVLMNNGVYLNGKVNVDKAGQIHNVTAGTADEDAVNVSQLNKQAAASKTTVSDGTNTNVTSTVAGDGHTDYQVNLNKDLTGIESISNGTKGKSKIVLNEGYAGMAYGDTNVVLMNNGVYLNGKVNVDKAGQIHNVTAGTADEDAVNVSQLNKQAAASKTTVSDGTNTNVTSTVAEDGHTDYKVNLNKDLTGIESMTNGLSSIRMGNGGTVTINNRVTIDQSGKISGVVAGEVKEGSTDAVNGSQLKGVENKADKNAENIQKNTDAIAKNTEAIDKNTKDISKNAEAISKNTENIKNNSKAIAENAKNIQKNTEAIAKNTADISKNTEAIGKLDERVTSVEEVAKKHTTVSTDDKNVQISEDTNKDGGKDYKVSLNKDLNLSSVTTGDTKMDTNGVTVKDVSLTKDGLSIGNKTYVSDKGLNANDQKVTNVAAGDISEKSTDAVNGSQLFATNQQVAQNAQSISKLGNRINKVGAGAAALAALHPLDFDPDDKWDFAAGYGNYNGENAAAIGAYYRPNEDTMFSVGGSFGNGENMVNAGVSLKLGQGNHVSTSKVAMAKEIKDLRKEMEGLKSALLDANAGKKLDTSKLQLFPDVPKNHWAYEYVSTLKGNGVLTGYPDGEFKGDRPMTRYEFATMLYKAMLEGATLSDKILKEFAPELERFTVDTVHQDKDGKPTVERVRTVKAKK